ncbi:hypothetical protein JB92DRAFT_2827674 [Gautieria morchelliformis]|nr:hypothetical protein JB92DRAFT_2827674 [Gautieria morchelliformis]
MAGLGKALYDLSAPSSSLYGQHLSKAESEIVGRLSDRQESPENVARLSVGRARSEQRLRTIAPDTAAIDGTYRDQELSACAWPRVAAVPLCVCFPSLPKSEKIPLGAFRPELELRSSLYDQPGSLVAQALVEQRSSSESQMI